MYVYDQPIFHLFALDSSSVCFHVPLCAQNNLKNVNVAAVYRSFIPTPPSLRTNNVQACASLPLPGYMYIVRSFVHFPPWVFIIRATPRLQPEYSMVFVFSSPAKCISITRKRNRDLIFKRYRTKPGRRKPCWSSSEWLWLVTAHVDRISPLHHPNACPFYVVS